jgi:flagellar motility protein MotE (MotC chaperone)
MKPKEAAEIFETMDVSFAAGFLNRMRPDAAAGILSNVETTTAYAISVVMAGRNAGAPVE